jgi:DNA polymerase-4
MPALISAVHLPYIVTASYIRRSMQQRKIIHIDMDAFYASVEQRDAPELRGRPVIVAWTGGRGVVLTASYEARRSGVHSAMPVKEACRLCPEGILVPPRFNIYSEVSQTIRTIFSRHADAVEPVALDEAYLDVTSDKLKSGSAIETAKAIKKSIFEETQLTASAGVSINKFVAKVASGMQKPDGLTFIPPSRIEQFMEQLNVQDFHGIGKVTAAKMNGAGIYTGSDLKKLPLQTLLKEYGKQGQFYYNIVRGIDDRPVESDRETKSISVEDTFAEDVSDMNVITAKLEELSQLLIQRMEKYQLFGKTITLKIKYFDFTIITRSKTFNAEMKSAESIAAAVRPLLLLTDAGVKKIRLLGIGASGFETGKKQLDLFA